MKNYDGKMKSRCLQRYFEQNSNNRRSNKKGLLQNKNTSRLGCHEHLKRYGEQEPVKIKMIRSQSSPPIAIPTKWNDRTTQFESQIVIFLFFTGTNDRTNQFESQIVIFLFFTGTSEKFDPNKTFFSFFSQEFEQKPSLVLR